MHSLSPLLPIFKALADPTRLALVEVLSHGAFNVSELCILTEQRQSTVSRHLGILLGAGVLASRREGREVYYRLMDAPRLPLAEVILSELQSCQDAALDGRLAAIWEERRLRSRRFFDTNAENGSSSDYLGSPDCLPLLLERMESGGVVADIGTGTGRLLPNLAVQARRVIAVDASSSMLERARALTAGGETEIDFRLGDLAHLPLADGEADVAVAHMVLHHAPDPSRAVAELARVVAPGGQVLLGDFLPHGNEWMREKLADQWLGLQTTDVRAWLHAAGLRKIELTSVEGPSSLGVFVATGQKPPSPGGRRIEGVAPQE